MGTPINIERWERFKREIEACLKDGFTPVGLSGGRGSAVEEAQRRLIEAGVIKLNTPRPSVLRVWLTKQEGRAKRGLQSYVPDWRLYQRQQSGAQRSDSISPRVARRWLLTAAQDDTDLHLPFWTNLHSYAQYIGARVVVGPFTYNKAVFSDHETRSGKYRPEIVPFIVHERVDCGPVLFCAEMNTLPTAEDPLSGLHTYTRGAWGVFPHAKRRLVTVPSNENPPVLMTTGCCTVENYIAKKAGLKAEFHHAIGAVLVEVDQEGDAHCRHIAAAPDGSFYDLDHFVSNGAVRISPRVEAITFGDIQSPFIEPSVSLATWGVDIENYEVSRPSGSIVDVLRPAYGVFHDLIDFKSISHHDEKRPSERQWTYERGHWRVDDDITRAARFLSLSSRPFMRSLAVESNHDLWLSRWVDDARGLREPQNRVAFFRYGLAQAQAIAGNEEHFSLWAHALRGSGADLSNVEFIRESEGFVICREHGGIDIGRHGHLGPNGGSPAVGALARVSGRATIGDKHSPEIRDGLYVAGTSCQLRLRYNKGPSSWRHAHVVHYPNGRRAILFIINGKWRA